MKTINAKLFALKYKLLKKLNASLEKDKEAIKNGAKITFEDYCKIQIVKCSKPTLDKGKVQEICNKYGIDITTLEKTTNYLRIDVDNVPTEIDSKVDSILDTLEDSNDRDIRRVASKVANRK